jgi:cytochrome c556
MKRIARWAPAGLLAIGIVCGIAFRSAGAQGVYNKAAFESAMEDATKSMRVLLGDLIGEDWAKTQAEAASLAAQAKKIHALTPKVGADKIADFQAHADTLEARANRLNAAAKARDAAGATDLYGKMVVACMDCHKTFRK